MRVLYFTRDYTTHDRRFLAALVDTAYQVYFLQLERRGHPLEDRPLPEGIKRIPWRGGQGPASLRAGPHLLTDLKRVLKEIKPDLVHAGPLQTAAFLVGLVGYRPLVSMSWGYDLLKDADRNILWRWATRYTLQHSAVLVGDCNTIRQKAIDLGMPDERIVTFPWGIDLTAFTPAASERAPSQTFKLLSTRGWEPIYGADILARAFVKAARRCPELRLCMLGNGSQAIEIRHILTEGGVVDRIEFPGQVSQVDLPRYYRQADLYISASHSDGTSISLLEAMACGCPALVSDIPGNREWVEPGVHGWWFPDGDVDTLTTAILDAVDKRHRLPTMGQAARKLAEQRADWEKNFQELLRAYQLAMNKQ
ncbi:MAG TPA: glycosyltransferase family 4 protein [Anaerolineales bacterium]|nr:glycosyltransferase family 4 protein [Anaerolineales bacterium]